MKLACNRILATKLEALCALEAILWGLWTANPFWNIYNSSSVWKTMNAIAPEWLLGSVVLALGLFQILSIALNCNRWRQYLAVVAIFLWSLISLAFIVGNYQGTASVTYPIFVIMSMVVYTEVLFERKITTKL